MTLKSKRRKSTFHGLSKKDFYSSYIAMMHRCYKPHRVDFRYYGGRGIKVCDSWIESAANFYKDMGDRPFKGAELDRIDPDGDYNPENCRWISKLENRQNQRRSKKHSKEYIKVKKENLCANCLIKCRV